MANSFYSDEAKSTINRLLSNSETDKVNIDDYSELSYEGKSTIRKMLGIDSDAYDSQFTAEAKAVYRDLLDLDSDSDDDGTENATEE